MVALLHIQTRTIWADNVFFNGWSWSLVVLYLGCTSVVSMA